jgi:hypothetical protein
MNNNAQPMSGGQPSRSNSHDYDNPTKALYKGSSQKQGAAGISTGGTNVIMEMDAENNEDESYYLSNSPVKK